MTFAIESTLEILSSSIKGATHLALSHTIPGKLLSLFSDFDDKIRTSVANTLKPEACPALNEKGRYPFDYQEKIPSFPLKRKGCAAG